MINDQAFIKPPLPIPPRSCHEAPRDGLRSRHWRRRAKKGCVVTKVANVGNDGETLLQAVTRYTNSQNAVRDKDFIALSGDFRSWHGQFADIYDVYLEIQRGGWDLQRALQRQRPTLRSFERHANATDLMKVYGAGWLGEAGTASGKNPPFLPNGSVFKRITAHDAEAGEPAFGAKDLYAAYLLQQAGQRMEFGRGARRNSCSTLSPLTSCATCFRRPTAMPPKRRFQRR